MHWVSFASAIVLLGFAGVCAWTARSAQRGGVAARPRIERRLTGTRGLPASIVWWFCAEFVLFAAGAAANGFAQLVDSRVLTAAGLVLMVSGVIAGVVGFRKRSRLPAR